MKECTKCREVKPFADYSRGNDKLGYRHNCKSCESKRFAEYKTRNLERELERKRAWARSPAGKYNCIKYGAKRAELLISKKDFLLWYENEPKKCFYCDIPEELLNTLTDKFNRKCINLSIDRRDTSKPYTLDNIVFACLRCNWTKSDFFTESEMREIAEKYIKPRWQNA